MKEKLEDLLSGVKQNRRDMLKKILLGTGVLALAAPLSTVVKAQDDPSGSGKGKGKGKGGKGKGKGKRPVNGKGKGKGKGKGRA